MSFPCTDMELLTAITDGDLSRVQQLVSSGMDINMVLYCQTRYESTTLLGTAAYEGQIDIMQYLIHAKALVKYQDPWLSRNALHWACIGGHTAAAKLLISENIDVNCSDKDNVTPLIFAAMFRRRCIIPMLIDSGANVNQFDRLHSTSLHYASFHGQEDVVAAVVRAGGAANDPCIFGQGTPLANLFYHNDADNCRLLVDAGYNLAEDLSWIMREPDASESAPTRQVRQRLVMEATQPRTLMALCRIFIRKYHGAIWLERKLCKLPLPKPLISYLCLV